MTDKSTLIALADKLEKATAPSRELDALIACACNIRPDWLRGDTRKLVATGRGHVSAGKHGPGFDAPAYTASIDAAVSLKPDGGMVECELTDDWHWWSINGHEAAGKPEASMARLCAAALRARAA